MGEEGRLRLVGGRGCEGDELEQGRKEEGVWLGGVRKGGRDVEG